MGLRTNSAFSAAAQASVHVCAAAGHCCRDGSLVRPSPGFEAVRNADALAWLRTERSAGIRVAQTHAARAGVRRLDCPRRRQLVLHADAFSGRQLFAGDGDSADAGHTHPRHPGSRKRARQNRSSGVGTRPGPGGHDRNVRDAQTGSCLARGYYGKGYLGRNQCRRDFAGGHTRFRTAADRRPSCHAAERHQGSHGDSHFRRQSRGPCRSGCRGRRSAQTNPPGRCLDGEPGHCPWQAVHRIRSRPRNGSPLWNVDTDGQPDHRSGPRRHERDADAGRPRALPDRHSLSAKPARADRRT